jgi:hypothetical protein
MLVFIVFDELFGTSEMLIPGTTPPIIPNGREGLG